MSRAYPNSDTIQPRYAAWLGSLGLPVSEAGSREVRSRFGSWTMANAAFMAWIAGCKASAGLDRIDDHDAFTEHCWKVAFGDVQAEASK